MINLCGKEFDNILLEGVSAYSFVSFLSAKNRLKRIALLRIYKNKNSSPKSSSETIFECFLISYLKSESTCWREHTVRERKVKLTKGIKNKKAPDFSEAFVLVVRRGEDSNLCPPRRI